jgi:ribonucleoside-diphosphate reductase beta chain
VATLIELTQQVDPGAVSDEETLGRDVQLMTPQQLYELWERQQWASQAIDLSRDPDDWAALDEADREECLWGLSSFFVGEERVTTEFSGLVMAYEDQQEEAFLTTQQVDEARHMQFYARFRDEVVGSPAIIAAHVESAREQVSPAFRRIFDEALVEAHEALVAAPGDLDAKVRFVTIYHLILESTLGLTSFRFITRYLEREGLLPGFVEGYSKIHHDEQRHIGYGTWFLREAVGRDPALADSVRATLRAALPAVAEALTPPDRDDTDWEALGASSDEIRDFAISGLTRRLNIVGVPLDSL